MRNFGFAIVVLIVVAVFASEALATETPYQVEWIQQLGTSAFEYSFSVEIDGSGNIYIGGLTNGDFGGTNAGGWDAYIAKCDASGSIIWTQQLGTSGWEDGYSVAIDDAGNAYITGITDSSLAGTHAGGQFDAFLAKYDASGTCLWTRQLGTSGTDLSESVAIDDSGNAYVSGYTSGSLGGPNAGKNDAFLAKYDGSGALLWTRQLGTSTNDYCHAVAIDGLGNAYISGSTGGSLGGVNAGELDAFLAKYSASGTLLWTRQIGTSGSDSSASVAVDGSGNAYISGGTTGSLGGPNAGDRDAFLAKYDSSGSLLWTRQLGTITKEVNYSVTVDGGGDAYITGYTYGDLAGPSAGDADAFLAKYDTDGTLLWTQQLGTSVYDFSMSVAVDDAGSAYITGCTPGDLGGTNAGAVDVFLVKFSPVPEPETMLLLVPAFLGLAGMAGKFNIGRLLVFSLVFSLKAERRPDKSVVSAWWVRRRPITAVQDQATGTRK